MEGLRSLRPGYSSGVPTQLGDHHFGLDRRLPAPGDYLSVRSGREDCTIGQRHDAPMTFGNVGEMLGLAKSGVQTRQQTQSRVMVAGARFQSRTRWS
jgi:hypothetical protein